MADGTRPVDIYYCLKLPRDFASSQSPAKSCDILIQWPAFFFLFAEIKKKRMSSFVRFFFIEAEKEAYDSL